MPISVVINTYNAEAHLGDVLDAVRGFDEVVVCDMESTDRTTAIANSRGCRVLTFPKGNCKSAEPARTFAIQSAKSPWVLVVDADEIVPPALRDFLYHHISTPAAAAGLYIPRKNYQFGQFVRSSYPDYQLRFFVREGTEWPPYVHTFPSVRGRLEHIPKNRTDLALTHYPSSMRRIMEKANDYSDNEVDKRRGKRVSAMSLFFSPLFRFVKSYFICGGIFNGKVGFISACNNAWYKFATLVKILERQEEGKGAT